jgi:hypothetical protein
MRLRILLIVAAAVAMTFAWPNLSRPVVSGQDGEEHMAGQLVLQLSQSQRGQIRVTKTEGVMYFGIPALDALNRKWRVDDVTRLMGNPRPSAVEMRYGCDLQYVIQFDASQDVAPVAADYLALPEVELACPNGVMRFDEAPNDPYFVSQYHYQNLAAATAWGVAKGDTAVLNVPLDDGLDLGHPDIQANLWINELEDLNGNGVFDTLWTPDGDLDGIDQDGNGYTDDVVGYDFQSGDPIPQAEGSDTHGTHCWGISNAVTNNSVGVAGTTWNSRSPAIRCGGGGYVTISAAISGIYYAMAKNVWAISMSFGSSSPYQPMANACQAGWDYGMVLFGSAGNDGLRAQRWPACYNGVENVAASGRADKKASWSNWGPWVDVTAPGEDIYATLTRVAGSYGAMSGTSMSAPLAAGVASWIKSFNPALTNQEALDMMYAACDTMPDTLFQQGELGAGRVSMGNAILPLYYSDLKLESYRFNDASGNSNGRPDPGENVSLIVTYRNTSGWRDATGVWATLTCSYSGVEIAKDTAHFPDIAGGASGNCSADSFLINLPSWVPPQNLVFNLTAHATPEPAYPGSSFEIQCGEPRVLIVDDDEGSDYEKYFTAACDSNGVLYDVYSVQASGSPSADTLKKYPVVTWFCGNDSVNTLTSTDQANLTSYLGNAGNLFISGQNIAQDIAGDGFLAEYLHAEFVEDSTGKTYVAGIPGDPISGKGPTTCDTMVLGGAGGANNARSCDGVRPIGGALGSGYYKDFPDTTVQAIIRYSGAYKVVYFACPFEAINHSTSRYVQKWTLFARILKFFGERVPGVTQELPGPDIKPYVLKVTPNPFRGQALVEFIAPVSGKMELRTYSTDGRLAASQTGSATIGQRMTFKLDGAKLANGIYLVQLVTPVGIYAQKTAVLK